MAKTITAARHHDVKQVMLAGGVAANGPLRQKLTADCPLPVLVPPLELCTDNAAIIASCAFFRYGQGKVSGLELDVLPNLKLV